MKRYFGSVQTISICVTLSLGAVGVLRSQTPSMIAPGDSSLGADRIEPHSASWRLVLIRNGNENVVGTFERVIQFVNHSAEEPAILSSWHFEMAQRSALDIYYLDRETLTPFARYVTSPNGMWVQYQRGGEFVASLTRRSGGEPLSFEGELSHPRFNNAMIDLLLAALPLEQGYAARIPTISTSGASLQAAVNSWVDVEVVEGRPGRLPSGADAQVWSVRISPSSGNVQLLSVAAQPPYLLKREVMNPSGQITARWDLIEVTTDQ